MFARTNMLERENKRKSQKDPRLAPRPGHLLKKNIVKLGKGKRSFLLNPKISAKFKS